MKLGMTLSVLLLTVNLCIAATFLDGKKQEEGGGGVTDHAALTNLELSVSGHTGIQPLIAGTVVTNGANNSVLVNDSGYATETYADNMAGSTNVENWVVDGNINLRGYTASNGYFVGDGSGLLDVNAETVDDLYLSEFNAANNLTLDRQTCFITNVGGTVYFETERIGGGDLRILFTNIISTLNCTSGSGIGGRARIALTAGTDTVPIGNYIYVTNNGPTAYLASSTIFPTGDLSALAKVILQSGATTLTEGPLALQRFSDDIQREGGRGRIDYMSERIRAAGAIWAEGAEATVTDDAAGNLTLGVTSGIIYQMHRQNFSVQPDPAEMYIVNDPSTPFRSITNLNQITEDALGEAFAVNRFMGVRLIGFGASGDDGVSRLFIELPSGIYASESEAVSDSSGYDNNTIENKFKGGAFNIARIVFKNAPGGIYGLTETQDKRGQLLNATGTGGGATTAQTFPDSSFRIYDNGDATKEIAFEASTISPSTTRTITMPDADVDLGSLVSLSVSQEWSEVQNFTQGIIIDGVRLDSITTNYNAGAITGVLDIAVTLSGTATGGNEIVNFATMDAQGYLTALDDTIYTRETNFSFTASTSESFEHSDMPYNITDLCRGRLYVTNSVTDPIDVTGTLSWYVTSERTGEDALYRAINLKVVKVLVDGAFTNTSMVTVDDATSFSANELVYTMAGKYRIDTITNNDVYFEDAITGVVDDDSIFARIAEYNSIVGLHGSNNTVWATLELDSTNTIDLVNWIEVKK